jgi:hypothetical protein
MGNGNTPVNVLLSDELIEGIECYRFEHNLSTRTKAIRCLLEKALNDVIDDANVLLKGVDESIEENIRKKSFREGQDDGYHEGFNDGYENGFKNGFNEGKEKGYNGGYARARADYEEFERNKKTYARMAETVLEPKKITTLPKTIKISKDDYVAFLRKMHLGAGFTESESIKLAEDDYYRLSENVKKSKE